MKLQYDHDLTRALYRIVGADELEPAELLNLLGTLERCNGLIGNSELSDVEIRDGRLFFCKREKLINNTRVYAVLVAMGKLPPGHNWDCDGVWLPVRL